MTILIRNIFIHNSIINSLNRLLTNTSVDAITRVRNFAEANPTYFLGVTCILVAGIRNLRADFLGRIAGISRAPVGILTPRSAGSRLLITAVLAGGLARIMYVAAERLRV